MANDSDSSSSRLERALALFLQWKGDDSGTSKAQLLAANEELRDLLEPMLDDGAETGDSEAADVPVQGVGSGAVAGRVLGGFRLVREVGRGGMGVVYEARQLSLNRRVALKILPTQLSLQPSAIARFRREAQTLSRLTHPHLARVYEAGSDGDVHYLAMEYVDGAPIDEILVEIDGDGDPPGDARLSLAVSRVLARRSATGAELSESVDGELFDQSYADACASIALQVAGALEHVHAAGILHRDVKPSNILLRADGSAVLTDFGLAKERGLPSVTMTGEFAGTPHYVAPEQAVAGGAPITGQADVFSLGATLYELLTRERAFAGGTNQEVLGSVMLRDPVDPLRIAPDLPPDIAAIALKALEKEPRRRYSTAAAMVGDLRAFLDRRPVAARRISRGQRAWRWARRNPVIASLGTGIVLLLLSGAVWTMVKNRELSTTVARLLRLSDRQTIERLSDRVEFIPAFAAQHAGAIEAWITEARPVVERRDLHEQTLLALREGAQDYSEADRIRDFETHPLALELRQLQSEGFPADYLARLEKQVRARRTWRFDNDADQWEHDALTELVTQLRAFTVDGSDATAGVGPWHVMQARLAHVRDELPEHAVADRAAWQQAIADIARPDSPYRGLRITPQTGLVPVGVDPGSGLWEFAQLQTGALPQRDADGQLAIDEATGLVLVLVPGGTFRMGARPPDSEHANGQPNVDPWATAMEQPLHSVRIDPFFIAKFEMTQAQWKHFTGRLSGRHQAGVWFEGAYLTGLQPVEYVSATECDSVLAGMGLVLPTEAQWEYAARAGTATVWWPGDEGAQLEGVANLADLRLLERTGTPADRYPDGWVFDDGFVSTAPVGKRRPNGLGLHDVHGNVAEWTSSHPGDYESPARPGDGYRDGIALWRVHRGGGYANPAGQLRSAARGRALESAVSDDVGLRPARRLNDL